MTNKQREMATTEMSAGVEADEALIEKNKQLLRSFEGVCELNAKLVSNWTQARNERDAARNEAAAFAVYRTLTTAALDIDPASCADDVREAVEGLRMTCDLLRSDVEAQRRTIMEACTILGVTDDDEADWPKLATACAAMKADLEELRGVLAALRANAVSA